MIYTPLSSAPEKGLEISKLHTSKPERFKLFVFANIFETSEKKMFHK